MTYKSILTIWDGKDSTMASIQKAIRLTAEAEGHLHIVCPTYITITQVQPYPYSAFPAGLCEQERERAVKKAKILSEEAVGILKGEGVLYSVETAVINRDQLAQLLSHTAKFCDLAILPRPFGNERSETDEKITESALLAAECPVLIVPSDDMSGREAKAVIAWDGSDQSLRAVRAAMPLLQQSSQVDVVIIANSKRAIGEAEIASDIATFLSRHNLNVQVNVVAKSASEISDVIRTYAMDIGANLVVMGGYGHSPLREFFFGGVTRDMLKNCKIPILMAH